MIVANTQDRIIECWCPTDSLPDFTKANYYKGDPINGIEFAEDNDANKSYLPVQQSSMIIDQDAVEAYSYVIDTNPAAQYGQTGHWNQL